MRTSVKMLTSVLLGLPESSVVKLSVGGKLYDFEVAGITRMNGIPDPKKHSSTREMVVLADDENFKTVMDLVEIKKVFVATKGREGEPRDE